MFTTLLTSDVRNRNILFLVFKELVLIASNIAKDSCAIYNSSRNTSLFVFLSREKGVVVRQNLVVQYVSVEG